MTIEHRVYGGPGCGKTTYLSRQIQAAVKKFGRSVLVCSFSNAAANELVTRGLALPANQVGTLHSFCRRAIGDGREIIETQPELEEWNNQYGQGGIGVWHVPSSKFGSEGFGRAGQDTRAWVAYGILRNQMVSLCEWPKGVQQFDAKWREFKAERDLIDFTDLIEITYREAAMCPFDIAVLFADEAQDYSALEMAVVRQWGSEAQYFVLAGDDQQALYSFRGASAEVLLTPELPPEQVTILNQSYRLPSAVLDYATTYGDTMRRFQPKNIQPVAQGGLVQSPEKLRMADPAGVVRMVIEESDGEGGQTVMVLASCDYMLAPVASVMRKQALLFHNPYRPTNYGWNPARGGVERLQKFLIARSELRWRHVGKWFEHLDTKLAGIPNGGKAAVKKLTKKGSDHANALVDPEEFERVAGIPVPPPDPQWFFARMLQSRANFYAYAREVISRHGIERFHDEPKIILGTFHSVKGGEADVVVMSPDLSRGGMQDFNKDPDPTKRMLYVGMTRAKKKLILLAGSGACAPVPYAEPYTPPAPSEVPF